MLLLAVLLTCASPAGAQEIPLIHARPTRATTPAARAPGAVVAPTPKVATTSASPGAQPFSAAQVHQITGAAPANQPVTLTLDHRTGGVASLEIHAANFAAADPGTPVWFKAVTGGEIRGPTVGVQAVAGRRYLLDFVVDGSARQMRVFTQADIPGPNPLGNFESQQTLTLPGSGVHHVPVMLEPQISMKFLVQLWSTDGEWQFVSCTVTPLQ
jgi:hypothetical protein